jgi:hypothetical protein
MFSNGSQLCFGAGIVELGFHHLDRIDRQTRVARNVFVERPGHGGELADAENQGWLMRHVYLHVEVCRTHKRADG